MFSRRTWKRASTLVLGASLLLIGAATVRAQLTTLASGERLENPGYAAVSPNGFSQASFRLEFDLDGVLPSAEGFTYVTGGGPSGSFGASESSVFSVSGGLLHMDTAALGTMMGGAWYQKAGVFDPALDLIMEIRLRLYEDANRHFFIYSIAPDQTYAGMILENSLIHLHRNSQQPATFPVPDTDFHTYRIRYTGATREYAVYLDGTQLDGSLAFVYVGADPVFAFGDGSSHPGFNGRADVDYIRYTQFQEVSIDIKPGSFPNSINPGSRGTTPVAILTTTSFDAASVNSASVCFGKTGTDAPALRGAMEDVDGDGDLDMVLHFNTQATGITCGTTSASLTGQTFSGKSIQGIDSVTAVGCN